MGRIGAYESDLRERCEVRLRASAGSRFREFPSRDGQLVLGLLRADLRPAYPPDKGHARC